MQQTGQQKTGHLVLRCAERCGHRCPRSQLDGHQICPLNCGTQDRCIGCCGGAPQANSRDSTRTHDPVGEAPGWKRAPHSASHWREVGLWTEPGHVSEWKEQRRSGGFARLHQWHLKEHAAELEHQCHLNTPSQNNWQQQSERLAATARAATAELE